MKGKRYTEEQIIKMLREAESGILVSALLPFTRIQVRLQTPL